VCLSNALLLGLARELKRQLQTRVVCFLQGEDSYVDALGEAFREPAWQLLRERARDVDLFIAPNRYFADLMTRRLRLDCDRVQVVPDGIRLDGYEQPHSGARSSVNSPPSRPPTIGFFARMCREKGLHLLVEAFLQLRRQARVAEVRLMIGGGCGPTDEPFVRELRARIASEGLNESVSFHPNLDRAAKIALLHSLDVFCVPATYPEAFGLYLLEAMAAGVPVVQPRIAGFPELVEGTGGGVLFDPNQPHALAGALESLLLDPVRARALGKAGQQAVFERFSARSMAEGVLHAIEAGER
jgi:glycosyltransferase involved in cell wall biosynthesis